jgi:hypothetical protein
LLTVPDPTRQFLKKGLKSFWRGPSWGVVVKERDRRGRGRGFVDYSELANAFVKKNEFGGMKSAFAIHFIPMHGTGFPSQFELCRCIILIFLLHIMQIRSFANTYNHYISPDIGNIIMEIRRANISN